MSETTTQGPAPILTSDGRATHLDGDGYPVERGIPHPVRYDKLPPAGAALSGGDHA